MCFRVISELVRSIKSIKKLDALRLKKLHAYYIKINRKMSVDDIRKIIMAPLSHMFDDHRRGDSNWCCTTQIEEDDTISVDEKVERMKVGRYTYKVKEKELYEKLRKKY